MKLLQIILVFFILSGCKTSEKYRLEAEILKDNKKYDEALMVLNKSIQKKPNNIKALIDRGVIYQIQGKYKSAIKDYDYILKIDPKNTLALMNRANNKLRLENNAAALQDLSAAIKTKGGEIIYMDKVQNAFVETGYEFDVSMEEIKYQRAIVYYNIDSFELAINDINFCIQKQYKISDCYYFRGLIYLYNNMNDQGCIDILKAKELGNKSALTEFDKSCK